MRLTLLFLAVWPSAHVPAAYAQDPFDPKAYIQNQDVKEQAPAEEHIILSRGIYKIEGARYQKFLTSQAAIYLPSPNAIPDMMETAILCPVHIRLMREVLPIREGLAIGKEFKPYEQQLLRFAELCRDGKVPGPSRIYEQPDGSVIEVRAKKGAPAEKPSAPVKKDVGPNK